MSREQPFGALRRHRAHGAGWFSFRLVAAFPLSISCVSSAPIDEVTQPITSSQPDLSDQTVVALAEQNGVVECTGTLVAPKVVLTAAHCFAGVTIDHVVLGDVDTAPTSVVKVDAVHRHRDFDLESLRNDIAVLTLAAPVEHIAPSAVELSVGPALDDSVLVVGYGLTASAATLNEHSPQGERRSGEASVSALDDTTLHLVGAPAQPCAGDSGGPVFAMRDGGAVLVAVTSYGDPQCSDFAVATRTDAFANFLAPWLPHGDSSGCSMAPVRARSHDLRLWGVAWFALWAFWRVRRRRIALSRQLCP